MSFLACSTFGGASVGAVDFAMLITIFAEVNALSFLGFPVDLVIPATPTSVSVLVAYIRV